MATGKKMAAALTSNVPPTLNIQNLFVLRNDQPVLTDFSLTLGAGEWMVIRGRNGCGKSTLLKTITGLISPNSGSIQHQDFCYLGHLNGFRETLTVRQHLDFVAQFFNVSIKSTPVDYLADLFLHHLSAGLKRQVALCQFILSPHQLWIMDEPFEHLDQEAQTYFTTIMEHHIAAGGSILQTSHESPKTRLAKEIWLNGTNARQPY